MFRAPRPNETPMLLSLAVSTGLFVQAEADALLGGVLSAFHTGSLGERHVVRVWQRGERLSGWVYFAPDPNSERVWNLWWIGVAPDEQGRGVGSELMAAVEADVTATKKTVLVVETSSQPLLEKTRRFYARRGYSECGRVPDFYGEGDDKVIFAKRLRR